MTTYYIFYIFFNNQMANSLWCTATAVPRGSTLTFQVSSEFCAVSLWQHVRPSLGNRPERAREGENAAQILQQITDLTKEVQTMKSLWNESSYKLVKPAWIFLPSGYGRPWHGTSSQLKTWVVSHSVDSWTVAADVTQQFTSLQLNFLYIQVLKIP